MPKTISKQKLLVVQAAALGYETATGYAPLQQETGLTFSPLTPIFPAVTCTAQAALRTATPPAATGVVCNGRFDRYARRTDFWNQSAALVRGPRIWDALRQAGGRVGMFFWQQSLGEHVDLLLSPAPIHKHHGGMIDACYGKPDGLYPHLTAALGRAFRLRSYWGPLASAASSRWITDALVAVMADHEQAPDLLLAYLPHLDYGLQKYGPNDTAHLEKAMQALLEMLKDLLRAARQHGYEIVLWGDYAITAANQPVYLNRHLRKHSLFQVRQVGRRTYADLYTSRALAMADHQVAHIYLQDHRDLDAVHDLIAAIPGVEQVLPHSAMNHPESGDLIAVAAPGAWFAYPWWDAAAEAPDFATHVDIHSKIGFDPCELFWGIPGLSVSLDAGKVRGTHGRTDAPAAFATTLSDAAAPASLLQLAQWLQERITP